MGSGLSHTLIWRISSAALALAECDSTIISHEIFPVLETLEMKMCRFRFVMYIVHVFISFIANSGQGRSHNVFGWIITFKVWMRVCCSANEISGQWDIVRSSKRINKIMTSFRAQKHNGFACSHLVVSGCEQAKNENENDKKCIQTRSMNVIFRLQQYKKISIRVLVLVQKFVNNLFRPYPAKLGTFSIFGFTWMEGPGEKSKSLRLIRWTKEVMGTIQISAMSTAVPHKIQN